MKVKSLGAIPASYYCPYCKKLLRNAVQTSEGDRLCDVCFEEIARWLLLESSAKNIKILRRTTNLVAITAYEFVCIDSPSWRHFFLSAYRRIQDILLLFTPTVVGSQSNSLGTSDKPYPWLIIMGDNVLLVICFYWYTVFC